jgi:hypothetical protein
MVPTPTTAYSQVLRHFQLRNKLIEKKGKKLKLFVHPFSANMPKKKDNLRFFAW